MSEQQQELARVSTKLDDIVVRYCRTLLLCEESEFIMKELSQFVAVITKGQAAPDSAGRILRNLRQRGVVSYEVVSRSQSRYRVLGVTK